MTRTFFGALAVSAAFTMAAFSASAQDAQPAHNDYAKAETWLCWPGKAGDACKADLTTTVIAANGKTTVEPFKADPKAPIDCFYVYPTVSLDPGGESDMIAGPEEKNVVVSQLARFGSKCRIYAPMYRQGTLTMLRARTAAAGGVTPPPGSGPAPAGPRHGYDDVVDAWNYYLAHENKGRGVVLIGHSQGSSVLQRMIKAEIDGKPVASKLIAAYLMGTTLPVKAGGDLGYYEHTPLCRSPSQTGCVIAFASYRDTVPPPANSLFGRVRGGDAGMVAACANPANLAGGEGPLHAYMRNAPPAAGSTAAPYVWIKDAPAVTTPFVSLPGMLSARCDTVNGANVLVIHVAGNPADPRVDDIRGDVMAEGKINAIWGLHNADAPLNMGNLVEIMGAQSKAWLAKK